MPALPRLKSQDVLVALLKSAALSAALVIFLFSLVITLSH
jgi:hypothetical protein